MAFLRCCEIIQIRRLAFGRTFCESQVDLSARHFVTRGMARSRGDTGRQSGGRACNSETMRATIAVKLTYGHRDESRWPRNSRLSTLLFR